MVSSNPKVAILGLGVGITGHLPAFRSSGFDVVALGATDREKVDKLAQENNVPGAYVESQYDELLKIPGLDVVVVASPPMTHVDLTLRALDAGKHVLIEKPFAPNAAEGEKMRAAAAKSDRTTMTAEAYRFAPSHAYVKELVDQGYIGDLKMMTMTMLQGPKVRPEPAQPRTYWRMSNQTGGGFSQGPLSTLFDSVIDWFGNVATIRGKVYPTFPAGTKQPDGSPADADDALTANFELANGAWGSVTTAYIPFGPGAIFDLMGSEGTIRLTQAGLLPLGTDAVSGGRFDDGDEVRQLEIPDRLREKVSEASPKIEVYHAYQAVVRKFAEGMASGTSPAPSFEDAQHLQRITDALKESSAAGGTVSI